jgi:pilus assembly protein CpaB
MNGRLVSILLTAFVIAGACAFLVNRVVKNKTAGALRPPTTRVIAASTDIKLGTLLTDKNLTTIEIAGAVPKGAILTADKAIGRGVVSNLYEGEPILDSRLAVIGSGGGLAATIHQGMRACAVKVDEVVGVAGFVTPGERVDVLISGMPPGTATEVQEEGTKVKTLLQNIEVLSAGTDIQKNQEGKPQQVQVVNLLVTPEQAEVLSLASNQTKIQLVLRNPLDTVIAETKGSAMSNLFADVNAAPVKVHAVKAVVAPKPAPAPFSIQIFNGSKRTDEKFASPEGK